MKRRKNIIPALLIIGASVIAILSFGVVYVPLVGTPPSDDPIIIDCTDGDDTVEIIKDAYDAFSIYLNGYLCDTITLTRDESSMNYTCNVPVHINLGEGNDTCTISYCYPGALTIMGGPGSDIIIPDDYTPPDIISLSVNVPDSSEFEIEEEEEPQYEYEKKSQNDEDYSSVALYTLSETADSLPSLPSSELENSDIPLSVSSGYTYKAWVLIGEEGNDILAGGPWNDFLLGGLGNDLLYLRVGTDTGIDRFGYNTFLTYGNTDVIIGD